MYKLDLTLHALPDSLNKGLRGHRMKYFAKNKKWDLLIFGMVLGKLPPAPLKKAHITIVRHSWRTLDYEGHRVSTFYAHKDGDLKAVINL